MNGPVIPIKGGKMSPVEPRANIGQMLLETGKLSIEDVDAVLSAQQQLGLRFGETAVRLKLINQNDVRQVLSQQFSYHYLSQRHGKFPSELIAAYQPFGKYAEGLRAIRSQLMLHWFAKGRKTLAIACLQPGDGASFFAANLAITFSQLGQKTVLVDANLRKPHQHDIFGLSGRKGLADILGRRGDLENVVEIDEFTNLSVLPAGTEVPNPQELLSGNGLTWVSNALTSANEIVLYDVPPLTTCADTLAIAKRAGGVLLIVRKDHSRLNELKVHSERLQRYGIEIVGAVMGDA